MTLSPRLAAVSLTVLLLTLSCSERNGTSKKGAETVCGDSSPASSQAPESRNIDRVSELISQLQDPQKREDAVRQLGELKDPQAVGALCELLGRLETESKQVVIEALGRIGDAGAFDTLTEVVKRPPWRVSRGELVVPSIAHDVQEAAVRALNNIDRKRTQRLLLELLDHTKHGDEQAAFAAEMLGKYGDRGAIEALAAVFKDRRPSNSGTAWKAKNALLKLDRDAARRAFNQVFSQDYEGKWGWESVAGAGLAQLGDEKAADVLIAALESNRDGARWAAARYLGEIGDARAVEPLIATLGDEDVGVRLYAAYSLGLLGDERAVEPLKKLLTDDNERVREVAAEALRKVRPAAER
ncbi:MAG: HEAT repeat domain-containing protein [Planctomycetota bacterium]|jgi:HEAT repeat protein